MLFFRKLFVHAIKISNWMLLFSSLILVFVSTIVMVQLEPETFSTPFDAFWWVMTTVTTVGYGDFYPTTIPGRLYAVFLYIFGIGLIGLVIGKVVDSFGVLRKRREEGQLKYNGEGHVVIIGWSQKARFAIREILDSENFIEIVIIDQLPKTPISHEQVHYIKGDPGEEGILLQANLMKARAVIVFTDEFIQDKTLADGKTLLIASAIERLAPEIRTTVEIMDEDHIKSFQHMKVDEFVLSREMVSHLAVRSALSGGISKVYSQLLSRGHGDDLYEVKKRPHWKVYRDAFNELLEEGATLIADRDQLNINRLMDKAIPDDAKLFVICDRVTYEAISKTVW
jgi:voltage-gated potassium channel